MSDNKDQYWACSACDSGGHPLTRQDASAAANDHSEETGHFTIWGAIKQRDAVDPKPADIIHVYEFVVDQQKVYVQAKTPIQAGYAFKERFGYWPTETNGAAP